MMRVRKQLTGLIVAAVLSVGAAPAQHKAAKATASAAAPASTAGTAAKVDINSASEKDLDTLPGVGPATAKKIVAGRPYSSVADLSRAGLKPAAIAKITPLAVASAPAATPAKPAAAAPAKATPASAPAGRASPAPASAPAPATAPVAAAKGSPGPGMVWVNKDTKVFHRQGDRWYGNTKNGAYMTEADALKAGYRDSKTGATKK